MKNINDFKIINNVAVLEGVAYLEEAKVVDSFLRLNPQIQYARVVTKDNCYFCLEQGKLMSTKEQNFLNPYYKEGQVFNSSDLEARVLYLEQKLAKLQEALK